MRYEILGPLRLADRKGVTPVSPRRIQTILAVLLYRADEMVTRDQLISEIWDDDPPKRATAAVHVYISQLRKVLASAGVSEDAVLTRQSGYILRKGSDEFDFDIFLRQSARGRLMMQHFQYGDAIRTLDGALALWRGPALGGLHAGHIVDGFATQLNESRLASLEMLIECRLAIGMHRELVGPLHSIVAEHPMRETFHRQLMVALYRSDRQADALRIYHRARKTLDDQLGVLPSKMLQRTQQAILQADDELLAPAHVGGFSSAEPA